MAAEGMISATESVVWRDPSTFIAGEWLYGNHIPVIDKYLGSEIGFVRDSTEVDVDRAVQAAQDSFQRTRLTPFERYKLLRDMSEWILAHQEEIIELLIAEVGKTYSD